MKLKTALELGYECGLVDVGDSILNIRMRVGQLFEVEDYKSLVDDYNRCKEEYGITLETDLKECLRLITEGESS